MGRALLHHRWLLCLVAAAMLVVQGYAMVHATEYGDHHYQHEHEHCHEHEGEDEHEHEHDGSFCVLTLYSDRYDDDVPLPAAPAIENIVARGDTHHQAYTQSIYVPATATHPRAPPFQA